MTSSLSPRDSFELAMCIRNAVTPEDSEQVYGREDFVERVLPLTTPRIIGRYAATHLRLFRANSGPVAAGATYFQDQKCETIPLGHVFIEGDGIFQGWFGDSIKGNVYQPVPEDYADGVKEDIANSLPASYGTYH